MSRTMTAHLDDALAERVDALAARWDRPRGYVVAKALETLLELEDERDRLTREGMASVRAGRTVAHAEVRAWAESRNTANPLPLPRPARAV